MKSVKNGSDDAIFSGKSTRAPAEVFELRPADWPGKHLSGQSARRSSLMTLSP